MQRTPPEFRQALSVAVKQPVIAEQIADLEVFATKLQSELGSTPAPYQLNQARLALADRYELLRRATPSRSRVKLTASFNQIYADLFDASLRLQHLALSASSVGETPAVTKSRPKSVADALAEVLS